MEPHSLLQIDILKNNITIKLKMPKENVIYTDGSCSRNGMKGAQCGIGIYFSERNPVHIGNISERLKVDKPTNNIAELTAIKRSLDILIEKKLTGYTIKIYTDSQYSIDCVEKWYDMWIEKNNFNNITI